MFPYPISFLGSADEAFSSTKSLNFDGVDDYVETPAVFSLLDGLSNFAFSFWFKVTSSFSYKQIFWIDGSSGTNNYAQTQLILRPNYLIWQFNNNSYYVYSNTSPGLAADTWYHVLCTRDDSRATYDKARIYINGVDESQYDSSGFLGALDTSTSGLKIGDGDYRLPFSGFVDEFAVYNQDMAAYASELYNSGTPNDLNNLATAPAPNVWYRMGEDATFKSPQILMPEQNNKDKVSNFSMDFDGTDDFVSIYDGASGSGPIQFNAGDDFSISAWIKTTNAGTTNQIVSFRGTAIIWFSTFLTSGNIRLKVYLRDNSSNVYSLDSYNSAPGWITSDTWTHVMFTRNGTSKAVNLYINGAAAQVTGTDTTSDNFTSYDKLSLGNDNYAGGRYWFDGEMDEVAIFSSDQSANAATIYNSGTPTDLTSLSPTAWYRMGEEAVFNSTNWLLPNKAQDLYSRYSLDFDGVNDYVDVGTTASMTDISISFWMKAGTPPAYAKNIIGGNTNSIFQYLGSKDTSLDLYVYYSAVGWAKVATNVFDNAWHHIVVTFDNSTGETKGYKNGTLDSTATITGLIGTSAHIGRIGSYITSSRYYAGNADEVSLYNTILDSTAVTALYNSGVPSDLTGTSGLTNWWRMGEDATFSTNWTIPDKIGSNTGTSANMTNDDLSGDAPAVTGNGTSANMTIEDRTGDAPDSSNNALSFNMDAADIVEETPPN